MPENSAKNRDRSRKILMNIIRVSAHRPSQNTLPFIIVLLSCILSACRKPAPASPTVSFLHAWWLQGDELPRAEREFREFTRETGIAIQQPPVPETLFSSLDPVPQLDLLRRVLQQGGRSPDILGIDVIWPGILAEYLIDLRPDFATELSSLDAQLVASYTVRGKVVALPYHTEVGVLAYRTDLLRQYGYTHPPETWDELESMATRIQAGERARGRKDFWGYVWQGAATEGLTCNALEWQVAEGGGRIIEDDETISVNNPASIRAWQRAARWIGRISPPAVVAYRETDSLNLWNSGNAAFRRSWEWRYRLTHPNESPVRDRTGYTSMPGARGARAGTLGGFGLAISQSSAHRQEAVALIRFLVAREQRLKADPSRPEPAAEPQLYDLPQILQAYAPSRQSSEQSARLVSRPSNVSGNAYQDVTQAYIEAVHSVLTGESSAPMAAAALEKQLVAITGFKTGPPKTWK